MSKTLLPSGCYDLLPPYARQNARLQAQLLYAFESFGYAQVDPPLLEFTDSLLAGRGAALSRQVFRVMDAGAHKVMGVRADYTMQIARIAATRLSDAPRPLRLSYAGDVLRMQPENKRGGRQLRQAGVELIGASSAEADAEIIRVAAYALRSAGITHFTIDLNLPMLATALLAEDALATGEADVLAAIAHKDTAAIRAMALRHGGLIAELVSIAGPVEQSLAALKALKLPRELQQAVAHLDRVANLLAPLMQGGITMTLDPAEARGFEYHTGIAFSLLSADSADELGRGGRYRLDTGEDATGATLYVDTLCRLLEDAAAGACVLVPFSLDETTLAQLHEAGYATLFALPEDSALPEAARRSRCTHVYENGKLIAL